MGLGQLQHASYFAKSYFALGFIWPLMLFGLWLSRDSKVPRLAFYFLITMGGSVLSTFFAMDTTRMFLPVLPVAVVACALVFDRIADRAGLLAAWLVVVVSNVGLALPNVLFEGAAEQTRELPQWYARLAVPILVQQIGGLVLVWLSTRRILRDVQRAHAARKPPSTAMGAPVT
jgi:hypothetical protein